MRMLRQHGYASLVILVILTQLSFVLSSNETIVEYELKRNSHSLLAKCKTELKFSYSAQLTHIYLNDDQFNDAIYKQYTQNNNENKLILAARNATELILLVHSNGKINSEILLKVI